MRWATAFGLVAFTALSVGCENRTEGGGAETGQTSGEASAAPAELAPGVLARVDGMLVSSSDFQQAARRRAATRGGSLSLDERRELLDELVAEMLLYQAALARGLEQDPQVRRLMARLQYQREIAENVPKAFPEDELQRYYEANQDEFAVPEGVRIRRILIKIAPDRADEAARAKAEELRAELVSDPESFARLATEHSEDPNLPRGAESHFLRREEPHWIDRTVVDQAFELEAGQLSPVFRSSDGYNILMAAERREREQRTFEAARTSVHRKVREERAKALYESYVEELRMNASIDVDETRLDSIEVPPPRPHPPVANPQPAAAETPEAERN
jgi:parvulin-like peptidyl-prolyl isomerase